jgi:predicted DNA-binding transcriptional regulator AlpA
MPRLNLHRPDLTTESPGPAPAEAPAVEQVSAQPTPLLIDIGGLAKLLARSVPSLHRDDAAGRLPAAVRIGGSKRWRYSEIVRWVEAGCPPRAEWSAINGGIR